MKHQLFSLGLIVAGITLTYTAHAAHHTPLLTQEAAGDRVEHRHHISVFQTPDNFFSQNSKRLTNGDIGASRAAKIAKSAYGGTVMGVKRSGNVYRVKLMQDGRVRIVSVDASTGQIVGG